MCVCVFLKIHVLKIFIERWFWELNILIGSLVELHVGLHSCLCFSLLEKLLLKARSTLPRYLDVCRASSTFSYCNLDTWWIDRESSYLLDSFSTPGGLIELLFLYLLICSSTPPRYLFLLKTIFLTPSSIDFLTPLDTFICRDLLRHYLNLLVQSEPHFVRSLSR